MADLMIVIALAAALSAATATAAAEADGTRGRYQTTASFEDFDRRATAGSRLNVVFFGGSLTWGANASDPNLTSYRGRMSEYLRDKYPRSSFTFHDAAIGGTGSRLGIFRLDRDVLSRKPDLVFLDFTANDGIDDPATELLPSYETLLRRLIDHGVPVVQVIFGFRYHFRAGAPALPPRAQHHLALAARYRTGVGNAFPVIRKRLDSGTVTLDQLWPFDDAHPDDPGYRLLFETARDGLELAIAEKQTCVVPGQPAYPDRYRRHQRLRLAEQQLPAGWRVAPAYRTSMWFDGLSSRWIDDVVMCDLKDRSAIEPLTVQFTGTFVGILGEADSDGLSVKVRIDGRPLPYRNDGGKVSDSWPWNVQHHGQGRLIMWRELAADLPPGNHTLTLEPVFPDGSVKGQLRIESICVAGD